MIVGLIAAFFLVVLGLAAKGVIVQALVVFAAWVTKNVLLLGFFQTATGKRTARAVRGAAYSKLGGKGRRFAFRAFGFIARVEKATLSAAYGVFGRKKSGDDVASYGAVPQPASSGDLVADTGGGAAPYVDKNDIPVEDLVTGIWRLAKNGVTGIAHVGSSLLPGQRR